MSRYIDAEEFAERLLNAWHTNDKKARKDITAIIDGLITPLLIDTPTADVKEVIHGEWIIMGDVGITKCSNCDWSKFECWEFKICPNCGADMRGENDDL